MIENDHALLARIDEKVTMLLQRDNDHEKRLRVVERNQWVIGGIATTLGVLLSYLGKKLGIG